MVQWNHARFGVRVVSKLTDSNPGHGRSVDGASLLEVFAVLVLACRSFPGTRPCASHTTCFCETPHSRAASV
ncbi:hypothetical protein E2C01_100061 [Portunus trituberculatus]|uniref:Uncharacterized protein n=1 Tax=Portunus trituberculatus TaxID=210409 RepID=A0A5B7KCJ5_PORTR|nr:hypothetical protein [Portunus trituberculatus]